MGGRGVKGPGPSWGEGAVVWEGESGDPLPGASSGARVEELMAESVDPPPGAPSREWGDDWLGGVADATPRPAVWILV